MNDTTDNLIVAYFDGACEPNPSGHAGYGCLIKDGSKVLLQEGVYLGSGEGMSSNAAEYAGLLRCLEFLKQAGYAHRQIVVKGDSKLVIMQMSGKWKIKKGVYVSAARKAKALAEDFTDLSFEWIPRSQNELCDSLAEGALPAQATEHQAGVLAAVRDYHNSKIKSRKGPNLAHTSKPKARNVGKPCLWHENTALQQTDNPKVALTGCSRGSARLTKQAVSMSFESGFLAHKGGGGEVRPSCTE